MRNAVANSEIDSVIGTVLLGKYKIIELLGAGGMSRVFKANQLLTKKWWRSNCCTNI